MGNKEIYKKITKEQVLDILIKCHVNIMNPTDVISIPNIAYLLKTSTYQVRKYMNQLKKDELVKIGYLPTSAFDEELSLPIKGFCITNKAKELEQYKIAEKAEHETLKRVFGI